jgi:hypothetical protein
VADGHCLIGWATRCAGVSEPTWGDSVELVARDVRSGRRWNEPLTVSGVAPRALDGPKSMDEAHSQRVPDPADRAFLRRPCFPFDMDLDQPRHSEAGACRIDVR